MALFPFIQIDYIGLTPPNMDEFAQLGERNNWPNETDSARNKFATAPNAPNRIPKVCLDEQMEMRATILSDRRAAAVGEDRSKHTKVGISYHDNAEHLKTAYPNPNRRRGISVPPIHIKYEEKEQSRSNTKREIIEKLRRETVSLAKQLSDLKIKKKSSGKCAAS